MPGEVGVELRLMSLAQEAFDVGDLGCESVDLRRIDGYAAAVPRPRPGDAAVDEHDGPEHAAARDDALGQTVRDRERTVLPIEDEWVEGRQQARRQRLAAPARSRVRRDRSAHSGA